METGVHPHPRIWIPFSNGMTDAVRYLDSGFRVNATIQFAASQPTHYNESWILNWCLNVSLPSSRARKSAMG